MSIVALASFKGSPGTTTASVCLAAGWPTSALLVEADPCGGDLVTKWDDLDPGLGLVPLGTAARRCVPSDLLDGNTQRIGFGRPEGIDVLIGVDHHSQARSLESSWPNVIEALGGAGRDVIIDMGRLLPDLSGGARTILERCDVTVVVMRATLDSAVKVKNNLAELSGVARRLGLLVVGDGYSTSEIESVLGIDVVGRLPFDDKGARMAGGESISRAKSPLFAACAKVARSLSTRASSLPCDAPATAETLAQSFALQSNGELPFESSQPGTATAPRRTSISSISPGEAIPALSRRPHQSRRVAMSSPRPTSALSATAPREDQP